MDDPKALYLDLMKKVLTHSLYPDNLTMAGMFDKTTSSESFSAKRVAREIAASVLARTNYSLMKKKEYDPQARAEGRDWPTFAHTMIGLKRLDNLQFCVEDALRRNVPGDLIETGVWRGGSAIFMRAVLKACGVKDRTVWVADSFEGLPAPDANYPADAGSELHTYPILKVSEEQVRANFESYGLLDSQVKFLKGFFKDTLPKAPIETLAVLRFDGDMYGSAMDVFNSLYDKLSIGGFIVVDDYGAVPACKQAVHDFRNARNITEPIEAIDWTGVYWQRTR